MPEFKGKKAPVFKGRKDHQVQISEVETDLRDKKKVSDSVKHSHIEMTHKRAIWKEVYEGKISRKYQKAVASCLSAEYSGSAYNPGSAPF